MKPIYAPLIVLSFAFPPLLLFIAAGLLIDYLNGVIERANNFSTDW